MISAAEAARGIYGAWRLAHGDRSGLSWFDASLAGFWRSFGAAIVALPAYAALSALAAADYPGDVDWGGVVLVEGIAYVIDWFAYPLAAFYLCRWIGRGGRFLLFIVALNWAKVIIAVVMLPAAVVANVVPGGIGAFLPVLVLAGVLFYVWHVTRVALDTGAGEAVLLTLANVAIGVATSLWARALLF